MSAAGASREAALAAIQSVMSRVCGVPPETISEATQQADIDRWDSLNIVLICIGLERRLGVPVDVEVCTAALSVGALIDALCASSESIG